MNDQVISKVTQVTLFNNSLYMVNFINPIIELKVVIG